MEFYTTSKEDELMHYGVLGMKWGVRKGNTAKAYEKASAKLKKLDKKATKYQKKAMKYTRKADKHWYGRDIYQDKANRNKKKAVKYMRKANKWYKQMDKAFKETNVKMTQEQTNIGRRYINSLDMRMSMYD